MSTEEWADRAERLLVDPRLGLIRGLVRYQGRPGMPRSLVVYVALVARTDRFAPWFANRFGSGAAFDDELRARRAAVGEAVERYCGNVVPDDLRVVSLDQMSREGVPAIDPREFSLYSKHQYAQPGFPFVPMGRDLDIAWVPARDLSSDEWTYVPASLVYLDYHVGARTAQPRTNSPMYAGIAAGQSLEQAQRSALEELLERDATSMWWLSGAAATRIHVTGDPGFDAILGDPEISSWSVSFLLLPSAFSVPVVAVLIEDRARGLVGFGTACRPVPQDAARKALTEAIELLSIASDLVDPHSVEWQAVSCGVLESHHFLPYRDDRAYLDDYGPDWRRMTDLSANVQLYLDPRMQAAPLDRLRSPAARCSVGDLPRVDAADPTAVYLHRLGDAGLRALAVDLTTPDVRAAGLHVTRVVVPGLYGNAPAAFPFLGGTRLYDVPAARGWVASPLVETDLVLIPAPQA